MQCSLVHNQDHWARLGHCEPGCRDNLHVRLLVVIKARDINVPHGVINDADIITKHKAVGSPINESQVLTAAEHLNPVALAVGGENARTGSSGGWRCRRTRSDGFESTASSLMELSGRRILEALLVGASEMRFEIYVGFLRVGQVIPITKIEHENAGVFEHFVKDAHEGGVADGFTAGAG